MTAGSLTADAGERSRTGFAWIDLLKLAHIGVQLGLAILVIQSFRLESQTFQRLMLITAVGFLVHAVLPQRLRQAWFILLSLAAIGIIFGLLGGLWLVGIGLGLIGIARLPISWWVRVGMLVAAGGLLAVMRGGILPTPFSPLVWPILASMFMFRLIVYMHYLRHHARGTSLGRTLAYFFMLPNIAFPLFPVVDYKTFDTTYYDSDRWAIYQTGVRWIARGLFHLVLYRFVYYYMAADWAVRTSNAAVFHVRDTLVPMNGSGDTSYAFAQLALFLSLAAVGCVIWSALDWKRQNYARLAFWLRMMVRYYVATAALS